MNSSICYAPAPTPIRKTDVFDFLRSTEEKANPRIIANQQCDTPDYVEITVESADGRRLRRKVPASRWREGEYRAALVRNMGLMVA